jgi:flagellar motor switch protein FliN/FliY
MTAIAHEIELEPLMEREGCGKLAISAALPFLDSVRVRVCVRIGAAELSVTELLKIEQGAVLALDRLVDEPLDVMVNDQVVARGTLVAVGEHFGVRVTASAIATQGR